MSQINKEQFIKIMELLKNNCDAQEEITLCLDKYHLLTECFNGDSLFNTSLYQAIIDLLKIAFNDKDDFIEWWIFETDFGRGPNGKYTLYVEPVVKINGEIFILDSIGKFYDFLIKDQNK